jgi:hypothetical protein
LQSDSGRKRRRILAISALGVVCFAAIVYGLSGNTGQRQSEAPLSLSKQQQQAAGNDATVAPSESQKIVQVATPTIERSVKTQSKHRESLRSTTEAISAPLNSSAAPATSPTAETTPIRSLAPKPKQVEETFYITNTGKRYHRGSCRYLRYSAYPITRAEAEAQGYTPCRVCYP